VDNSNHGLRKLEATASSNDSRDRFKTGIYFDEVGTVLFYPMKWKVVTYINLEPTRGLWKQTKIHQRKVNEFCQKIRNKDWYHYTECAAFGQYMR
jgi:hypothetical protein